MAIGVGTGEARLDPTVLVRTERIVTGSRHSTRAELIETMDMMARGPVEPVIGMRVPFTEVETIFEALEVRNAAGPGRPDLPMRGPDEMRKIHLVGSAPFGTAEEMFRTAAAHLGARLKRLPDGEVGERDSWIKWQHARIGKSPQFRLADVVPVYVPAPPYELVEGVNSMPRRSSCPISVTRRRRSTRSRPSAG